MRHQVSRSGSVFSWSFCGSEDDCGWHWRRLWAASDWWTPRRQIDLFFCWLFPDESSRQAGNKLGLSEFDDSNVLKANGSPLLKTLTLQERPGKMTFRYWQEGPGATVDAGCHFYEKMLLVK